MHSTADSLLVLVLLLNLYCLGSSRLRALVFATALQGFLLAALPLLVHHAIGWREIGVAVGAAALKGIAIPRMLLKALANLPMRREIEPLVGYRTSLLLGAVATGAALAVSRNLPTVGAELESSLIVPASFASVLAGFLLITTRTKALTQVLGYLVLENGIFIFGQLLLNAVPLLVEIGVLLDLFVAIFIMGIILNHVTREFAQSGTERLAELRD